LSSPLTGKDGGPVVAAPVSVVVHEVGRCTLGINALEPKFTEYEPNSYNTAPETIKARAQRLSRTLWGTGGYGLYRWHRCANTFSPSL